MALDFYDDFAEPVNKARGPKHAAQVDPERAQKIDRDLAAMTVRRMCNQHRGECTGLGCTHPNHRLDVDYLLSEDREFPGMLDMLGLPRECPDITEQDRVVWLKWLRQAGPPEDTDLHDAA